MQIRDALTRRAQSLEGEGKHAEAIEVLQEIMALEREVYGRESTEIADSHGWLAQIQESAGDFVAAELSRRAALEIFTKVYGKDEYRVADARRHLATTRQVAALDEASRRAFARATALKGVVIDRYRRGQYAAAIPAALESLDLTRKVMGDEHPLVGERLDTLAVLCQAAGDNTRAEPLFRRALAIRKAALGEWHPDYAATLNNLAVLYKSRAEFDRAESLFQQALAIKKKVLGEDDPDYARSLNNLAHLYLETGEYVRAEPLFLQALAIKKKVLGEHHPDYATSLNNLAVLYQTEGDYVRSEPLLQQALAIWKATLGERHPQSEKALSNLAVLYALRGDFARAAPLFEQSLAITKETVGEEHPDYATGLGNLAEFYVAVGTPGRALPLMHQALAIAKKVVGEEHPAYAMRLRSLADLYATTGDRARAEPLYNQALATLKKTIGEQHPDYATCLVGMASLYDSMGDLARAESLYEKALAIQKKSLGEQHGDVGETLRMLANLYEELGDFERAEPLQRRALEIKQKSLGENHFLYARSLNILADFYRFRGDYARAEPLYQEALDIDRRSVGEDHPDYAVNLVDLAILSESRGDFGRAESLFEQALELTKHAMGEDHPEYAERLINLAHTYLRTGRYDRAEPLAREALDIMRRHVEETLPALSEAQSLALLDKAPGPDLWLSLARELPQTDRLAAWSRAWRSRGLIGATQRQRRLAVLATPETAPLMADLRNTQQQLAQLTLAVPAPDLREARQSRLSELNDAKEDLEKRLAVVSSDFRDGRRLDAAGPDELLERLPPGTAVVDLARIVYSRREIRPGRPDDIHDEWQYEAFIARTSGDLDPALGWVHLGPANPIDEAIKAWRAAIVERDAPSDEEDAPEVILRKRLWLPLEEHFAGSRSIIVIPDGPLATLPWSALPGQSPGTHLLDEYQITIASHGRQLIQFLEKDQPPYQHDLLLVGGVDYDHRAAEAVAAPVRDVLPAPLATAVPRGAPALSRGRQVRWKFLPGTKAEAQHVAGIWQRRGEATSLSDASASESAFRAQAPQARFVHLATHGFFADPAFRSMFDHATGGERLFGSGHGATRANVTSRNPMVLTGVVLAGANLPPSTDELGLPTGEDGILTAEEVVSLDLCGTQLVVLSACETGLGEIGGGGEGVFGLQRAFHLAGARNVVASLWRVSDAATMVLMTEFYKNLWERSLSPAAALRRAQLVMLAAYDPQTGRLRPEVEVDKSDDAALIRARAAQLGKAERTILPPYFWSAFSLSGDWR